MNISEEKRYLYDMMKEVTEERRKLTEMYYGLKERLDFLHEQEQKGLEDLSLKGYVDLANETKKQIAVTNIQRETENLVKKIESNNIEESRLTSKINEEILNSPIKKYTSTESKITKILEILKDSDIPIHIKEIYNKLNEDFPEIKYKYLTNNLILDALKKYPRIQRVSRGYYQYKF